jgi:predicted transcriptional regulator
MKRITVIMPDEVYDKVIKLAKKEKRSKSAISAILIEDGLKAIK